MYLNVNSINSIKTFLATLLELRNVIIVLYCLSLYSNLKSNKLKTILKSIQEYREGCARGESQISH